jgi:hypothetical protein
VAAPARILRKTDRSPVVLEIFDSSTGHPIITFFYHGTRALVAWSRILDHTQTPQFVGLPWTSDQPDTDLSLVTRSTLKRQTSMPPAGFEPTVPSSERPQTHALGRAANEIGQQSRCYTKLTNRIVNYLSYVHFILDNHL